MDSHNRRQIEYYQHAFERDFQLSSLGSRDNRNAMAYITAIMEFLSPAASDSGPVLEIGTGTGFHAQVCIEQYGVSYLGSDISIDQLRRARRRLEDAGHKVMMVCCEAENLPFKRGSLNAIYLSGTLHHVSDPAACVAECNSVLGKDGRLALVEPNPIFPTNLLFAILMKTERNMLKMSLKNLRSFCQSQQLYVDRTGYLVYTPPHPRFLWGLYDLVEAIVSRMPVLRRISVMLFCFARKP